MAKKNEYILFYFELIGTLIFMLIVIASYIIYNAYSLLSQNVYSGRGTSLVVALLLEQ